MTIPFGARRRLLTWVALAIYSPVLFAQVADSIIVGIVTDGTGAAVPNATITATNKDTNVKYDTVANSGGEYRINNIPVGRYDVAATASGFSAETIANVELELNQTASVNLALKVSAVTTSMEVREASAPMDTSTAQLQNTYDAREAIDLPSASASRMITGSGIWNLSLLGAGVASSGGIGQGVGPSVGGQRPEDNAFNIDGVSNDSYFITGPLAYVSNEAVSQFTVLQNVFSPEFGNASGGVFNVVMKTGANQIHGSVYEYLQNRNLDAVDAAEVQQQLRVNPRYDNNRIGATIGGPIVKNKLFYFGNFEYNPIGLTAQPAQTLYAPTAAGIATLNSLNGLSKTNLGVFEKYVPVAPAASRSITVAGSPIPIGPLSLAAPAYENAYNAIAAVDWNISGADQLRGRYLFNKDSGTDTNASLPAFYVTRPYDNSMVSLSEFHTFSPTLENELRISFNRNNNNTTAGNLTFPGLNVFPNLAFYDLNFLQIGPDPSAPSGSIQNLFQAQEHLTKTVGRHTITAGYDFTDVILTSYFVQYTRGLYLYSSLQQYLEDLTPNLFGTRSLGAGGGVPVGFLQNAAYVNDDFRIRPNLTLNLGLRYEYVTVPVASRAQQYSAIADVPGVISFNTPQPGKNDWSPRVGFAYSPGHSQVWTIRGGFARVFDNPYGNLAANAAPEYYQTTENVNPLSNAPNFLAAGGLPALAPTLPSTAAQARAQIASYTWNQNRPYALNGTLGVERLLGKDYTLEARYVYTKGVHLWVQDQMNITSAVTPAQNLPTFLSMPSAAQLAALPLTLGKLEGIPFNTLAQYGFRNPITSFNPIGNSRYNGLALQMRKTYSNHFSYLAAYTWSHDEDDSTAPLNTTILSPRRPQNFQNLTAEWASSALDRRQRFTFSPVYDLTIFGNRNWLMKNVVSNWNISFTYTYQTPEYVTIQSGVDSNLNGDPFTDRTVVNPNGIWNAGSGVTPYNAQGQAVPAGSANIVAYVANNPNSRYVAAGLGAYANGGRNTFPLSPINNVDAAVLKRLSVSEKMRVEIGAQFFNLFNHPQFVGGLLDDVAPFNTSAVSRNFLVPGNPSFGQYQQFFPSNARVIQAVARFIF